MAAYVPALEGADVNLSLPDARHDQTAPFIDPTPIVDVEYTMPKTRRGRRLKRRSLNVAATLTAYENRLRDLDVLALRRYLNDGDWLTTYDVWDTHTDAPQNDVRNCNAFVALRVLRERGIRLAGVCTEHRTRGKLISEPAMHARRVYVGKHNTFNSLNSHEVLSIMPSDKRYFPNTN